jgi:hypothetical protein
MTHVPRAALRASHAQVRERACSAMRCVVARGVQIRRPTIMQSQAEQQAQSRPASSPSVATQNFPVCKECGDADDDTRHGAAICRRCGDAALAQTAFTD